jgi:hypothetical protein
MECSLKIRGKERLGWMCIFILLVAACAGTVHVCELGIASPVDGYSTHDSISTGHAFCAICALSHSPSVLPHVVSLLPTGEFSEASVAAQAIHASQPQILAFRIRPPPLF